jgi:hypothetical protein
MSDEELLMRGLPKWPQMIVTGPRLREDLALEVIRRTDAWFVSGDGCNDRDGDRRLAQRFRMPHFHDYAVRQPDGFDWKAHWDRCDRWKTAWGAIETEYVRNNWIGSSFIHGPHGWCHPDGQLHYIDNVGKWPSIEEIRADWQTLATAFPFLILTVTLMSGESCEDDRRPIVAMDVADGQVSLKEPTIGAHGAPRREFGAAEAAVLFDRHPAQRERYPFREEVLLAWEKKALEVDAELAPKPRPLMLRTYDGAWADEVPIDEVVSADEDPGDNAAVSGVEFRAIEAQDTCMPWASFMASCRDGFFTVEDGYGELATDLQVSDVRVDPLDALNPIYARPSWATHVCWYNR